jgi:hypothetical protein
MCPSFQYQASPPGTAIFDECHHFCEQDSSHLAQWRPGAFGVQLTSHAGRANSRHRAGKAYFRNALPLAGSHCRPL